MTHGALAISGGTFQAAEMVSTKAAGAEDHSARGQGEKSRDRKGRRVVTQGQRRKSNTPLPFDKRVKEPAAQ